MTTSSTTTDHQTIRDWAESRDGHPAKVKGAKDGGILRFDFGEPEESLEQISWDEFFEIFDGNGLALVYQDETADGKTSRFCKFIDRH
ncbi:hypothetical protein BJF92_05090 [Rhizobium rhizosphaerae]|uniref:1,4-alpha-glucan branching enzyme n=1 Tax=Xaviernesmea rhizosphaerae TaxID=1672749 RepID=A0A1Q9AEZ4_9HYPH|nr:hypothetical protein [Xaviernesmea rhizosphaerae]OLP53542.1 hypothetical protein BJF92_05090 [Xaviernesmea rhizosphaerae]